jgi:hypothetical protein
MGMDSKKLSAREKQPGHDKTYRTSEENFVEALRLLLPPDLYTIVDHPRDLANILGGRYGVIPEASIEFKPTGRKMYFEVKKQGDRGNADERACKHHTVQFYKTLAAHTGFDYHPFCTVMCQSLAVHDRYITKHPYYFESDHYLLWRDYNLGILKEYLDRIRRKFLERVDAPDRDVPA